MSVGAPRNYMLQKRDLAFFLEGNAIVFAINFDYRFDTEGFFDDPKMRALLESAARVWEDLVQDEFANIPAGTEFTIVNPTTGENTTVTLTEAIDDVLVFVGSRDMGSRPALAYPTGLDASGDVFQSRIAESFRGQGPATDFEPWAGWLALNPNVTWHLDHTTPVTPGAHDMLTHVVHQIAHILGFGISPIFFDIGAGASFDGPNALSVNNGMPIPLGPVLGHVIEGFNNNQVLMDPIIPRGVRLMPGEIDLAMLSDIGYVIDGFQPQGNRFQLSTSEGEAILGQNLRDLIDAQGGNDVVFGGAGNDILLGGTGDDTVSGGTGNDILDGGLDNDSLTGNDGDDTLRAGFGNDTLNGGSGADVFDILSGGGHITIKDFSTQDSIILRESGFTSGDEALAAIEKPTADLSRLIFLDGTTVDIQHTPQAGTPLNKNDFLLAGPSSLFLAGGANDRLVGTNGDDDFLSGDGSDTIEGGPGADVIQAGETDSDLRDVVFGGSGSDSINGGYGNDSLVGGGGDDTIEGGFGVDTIIGNSGNDVLAGSAFSDILFGNDGNDFVNGGFGSDRINGGAGADTFFHFGVAGHGSDWIQDYDATDGDVLLFGNTSAAPEDFRVTFAHTENSEGERSGDDNIQEVFVVYRPTGQIMWALVDGEGETAINLKIGAETFDLLT
ncbi:calcium-binding protein [Ruegeria marisflavi]|uniref:calcium-binding protein n=1 Tax=Ruegeria marisflavi TaxID=2984152 RepID=UPI0029587DB6|nr:calcium-binding protein [Ruegeria sp. WL0004]